MNPARPKRNWSDFSIAVPKAGTSAAHMLLPGSAVVIAEPERDGKALCYYEGNEHGACNVRRFLDKAYHAAGRAAERYPTSALALFDLADLAVVGSFDADKVPLFDLADPAALHACQAWLGDEAAELDAQRAHELDERRGKELSELMRKDPAACARILRSGKF